MVVQTNEFRNTTPVLAQPGQNAGNGGFNPFQMGMFGSYFGNTGGGVPDASSGFRYRDKRGQLQQQADALSANLPNTGNADFFKTLADAPDLSPGNRQDAMDNTRTYSTPGQVADVNKEIDTLDADRNSYIGTGLASGLPGAVSSVLGIVQNEQGLNRLEGINPESYIPQESKDAAAAATLASNSSSTSDRNQRISDINTNTNMVTGNAQLTARTPEEVQQVVLMAQKNANKAVNELGREGVAGRKDNKRYADTLNMKLGDMRQGVKNMIETKKSQLREARTRNAAELATNLGITALTMGV